MCHKNHPGDGCHGCGSRKCGGNLLQANVSPSGLRGLNGRVKDNLSEVRRILRAFWGLRRTAG